MTNNFSPDVWIHGAPGMFPARPDAHDTDLCRLYVRYGDYQALDAENARLRDERDEQRERAEEAESEITRAQEQVSAEFERDCWKALRALLDRTDFDWSQYSEDGVTADDAYQWIAEELDRLDRENARLRAELDECQSERLEQARLLGISAERELRLIAERDAAWRSRAEAMREAAALAAEDCGGCVPGGDSSATRYVGTSMDAARAIRAMPIPEKEGKA